MQVRSLSLKNFRSWEDLTLEFGPVNILIGPNAQGKSNIIEAIYLLGTGKSFRRSRDAEMIYIGFPRASVTGVVLHDSIRRTLHIRLNRRGRKTAAIDNKPPRRLSELLRYLQVVVFSPENLALVQGGPRERRNYLDVQAARRNPGYLDTLIDYGRVCAQRGAVLRECAAEGRRKPLLEPLTKQLELLGVSVIMGRLSILSLLEEVAGTIHRNISGGRELLTVSYESALGLPRDAERGLAETAMRERLDRVASAELSQGRNLAGPHRDDLKIMLDGLDVRRFGSQGQKRSVAVSLKIAEVELVRKSAGFYPVMLMDDVFSELDMVRSEGIVTFMRQGPQIFLTTTNAEKIPGNLGQGARVFAVSENEVSLVR